MKKTWILFIFLIFLSVNASAYMVSFYIIETGLPQDPDNVRVHSHSVLWENAFMDVFFDAGFIVGNAPILRMENKPSGDILNAASVNFKDARDWGIDFILITQLDYNNELSIAENIAFFVYMVSSGEKIYEKQIKRSSGRMAKEEFNELKTIVRELVPFFQ